jgi:hypothetical protein
MKLHVDVNVNDWPQANPHEIPLWNTNTKSTAPSINSLLSALLSSLHPCRWYLKYERNMNKIGISGGTSHSEQLGFSAFTGMK